MFRLFRRREECCRHEWEIVEKMLIYPKKDVCNNMYTYTTWNISDYVLQLLKDKNISKDEFFDKLNEMKYKEEEDKEFPVGIYILQKCKHCGELKELKTEF